MIDDMEIAHWNQGTIGDLLKVRNGFAFKSRDYQDDGALLVRQSNLGGDKVDLSKAKFLPISYLEEYTNFIVNKGDILIGMSGSVGKLCTYEREEPALQNQRTGLLVFQDQKQKKWVWHFLPLLERELLKAAKGVAVQNVSARQIESFPIPVPPLDQQKRIVEEIEKQFSRLDETVRNLKRVKANLKRYKASVLQAAVTGKLTEEWRKQNPDVEPASKLLERILIERRQKWEEAELAKMRAKGLPAPKDGVWWVYVILCDDNSYYVGASSDMPRRWSEHTGGKGAEWTKKHHPIRIIHHEKFCSQDDAFNREKELKTGFGRKWLKREFANDRLRQAGKEPKNDKWKEKYKEPTDADVSGRFDLPYGWEWSTFEQVSERVTVGHVGSMRNEYTDSGIPFLRSQNVRENRYDPKGLKFISPEFHSKLGKSALQPGDMVVVRSGSVGVTCIIPESLAESNCSDLVIVKQPKAILPQFGAFYMNSIVNTHVAAQKVGIALTHFNTKSVAAMPVPLPSLEEQRAIVQEVETRFSVAEKIEVSVDANLQRADRLRQSILKQAFSGKLI